MADRRQEDVATRLVALQNPDGSWYEGYHYITSARINENKAIGANSWLIYSLTRYAVLNPCRLTELMKFLDRFLKRRATVREIILHGAEATGV